MENIIQLLKDNEKPFGLMSTEMQEKAEKIRIVNFVVFNDLCSFVGHAHVRFYYNQTYRLRADYEDEPEIVEYKITIGGSTAWMGKLVYTDERVLEQGICEACADPDFLGFKFESGQVELTPIVFKSDCSTKSICQFRDLAELKVLHATAVLFRREKQE